MDKNKTEAYYRLFEQMVDSMNVPENFVREDFVAVPPELCELFNISKVVTEFYRTISLEKAGRGERCVEYDNGRGEKSLISKRLVSRSKAIVKGTIYVADDREELTDDELSKLDLILRTLLDFKSRNRLMEAVEELGFRDDLGYPNFRSYVRYLEQVNINENFHEYTAIHYNLRHFNLINKEVGLQLGDVVMRNYFNMIEQAIGDHGIVCRLGGDNYVAIVKNEVVDEVVNLLNGVPVVYNEANNHRVMVSSSAGLFDIPEGFVYKYPGDIMDKMASALQSARMGGMSHIVYYNEKMLMTMDKFKHILTLFPEALEKGEFKAFYQPKIDVRTGSIVGAEALCRWFHDGKLIPPMDFIPILEQNMNICALDFYMLDLVCKDIRKWLEEGRKAVRTSVNLSRKHLADTELLEHIIEIIDRNGIPHEYIEIELTETTTDVEFRDLKRVVSGLQQEGIFTSVDDFGMGYSSLNLIREMPWNILKVDRCFLPLDDDDENSVTSLMFKHVLAMAQDIGLQCITEGVETIKQVELLRKNNCNVAQGFYFDKPLPKDEFEFKLGQEGYYKDRL